jgi:hypothetical protein
MMSCPKGFYARIINACENHGIDSVEKLRQEYMSGRFAGYRNVGKQSTNFLGDFFGAWPIRHESHVRCWCSVAGKRKKTIQAHSSSTSKSAWSSQEKLESKHDLALADFVHGNFSYAMKPESVQEMVNNVIHFVLHVQHTYKSWHKKYE